MIRSLKVIAVAAACMIASILAAIGRADAPPVPPMQTQLHGQWRGAACEGTLIVRADGSFERRSYSPGGHTLKGTWQIAWQPLPPKLTLTCREATSQHFVGWVQTMELIEVDERILAFRTSAEGDRREYKRKADLQDKK